MKRTAFALFAIVSFVALGDYSHAQAPVFETRISTLQRMSQDDAVAAVVTAEGKLIEVHGSREPGNLDAITNAQIYVDGIGQFRADRVTGLRTTSWALEGNVRFDVARGAPAAPAR